MEFITLSKNNIKNINFHRNTVLCLFSEPGAQGDPGMVRFFIGTGKEITCYQGNYMLGELTINTLKRLFPPISSSLKSERIQGYQYEYLGAGNHLFINNRVFIEFADMKGDLSGSDIYAALPDMAQELYRKQQDNLSRNFNLTWSRESLNTQKLGTFCEYYAKMVLTSYGMNVYTSEVDDHGIDFVAEGRKGFLKFQVKSIRPDSTRYAFVHEKDFDITDATMYLFLITLNDGELPDCYIIPATAWGGCGKNALFVHHADYKVPEYGVNVSDKNLQELQIFSIGTMIQNLI